MGWDCAVYALLGDEESMNTEKLKPLTDNELNKIIKETWGLVSISPQRAVEFARSIERAHGIGEKE